MGLSLIPVNVGTLLFAILSSDFLDELHIINIREINFSDIRIDDFNKSDVFHVIRYC